MPEKRKHIKKILIANRGEIALRVQRTARRMGIATVAVYSNADREAAFVKQADTSILLEGNQLSETYLNIEKIIAIAQQTGADTIHPGYGFLSESPGFADACEKAGLIFIGPDAAAMKAMGNKIAARETAVKAGIPVIPGITGAVSALLSNYASIGFPLLVKAAAGGGGKGMRIVYSEAEIQTALEATAREAQNYFGDSTIYIEKYIAHPRHIEVQVLGDHQGNIIHLYERECSLQRRHQKIIEEAPSPTLDPATRQQICNAAVQLAKSIGYYNAGTMEFLADERLNFYFLEMNTRIQVEHPVTELTTGIDIVEQQIKIAAGEALQYKQEDIQQQAHAIECRIYAEDPAQGFLPSPGLIKYYEEPAFNQGTTIRIDGMQLQNGDTISGDFDPMISKLIVSAATRDEAQEAMLSALQQYHIKGIKTNIEFLTSLMQHPDYIHNNISTKYIDDHLDKINSYIEQKRTEADITVPLSAALIKSFGNAPIQQKNIWHHIGYWRHIKITDIIVNGKTVSIELIKHGYPQSVFILNNKRYEAELIHKGNIHYTLMQDGTLHELSIYEIRPGSYEITCQEGTHLITRPDIFYVDAAIFTAADAINNKTGAIVSPMPGKVISVNIKPGDSVKKGQVLLIVEAMKMENNIVCNRDAIVEEILVKEGDKVDTSSRLVKLSEP